MIGTTLQRSKTARESRLRALVFFLALSVLFHGTFFAKEWLLLGAGMAFLSAWTLWTLSFASNRKLPWRNSGIDLALHLSLTDGLFLGLIFLSLIGLVHPVRVSEGLLDAVRWFTLWMVYRVALSIQEEQSLYVVRWIEGLSLLIGVTGWILSLSSYIPTGIPAMDGRLASLFGYPNALAAYLGAVLLLKPRSKWVRAFLFVSLLNTGSRAALVLFLTLWSARKIILWIALKGHRPLIEKSQFRERIFLVFLLSLGLFLTVTWNEQAVAHLMNWGISTSLGERILYFQDGIQLALLNKGLPQAGGWFAFPLVQNIPYWTTDPHSLGIRVLLHQGLLGLILLGVWGIWIFLTLGVKSLRNHRQEREYDLQFIRGGSVLLFLALHSLVDTDFLFGALGVLFWLLFGIYFSTSLGKFKVRRVPYSIESFYTRQEESKRRLRFFLCLPILGLGVLLMAALVNPQWLQPEIIINNELTKLQQHSVSQDSFESNEAEPRRFELLQQSIQLNQTQNKVRQEIARLELEKEKNAGLAAVEEVLAWEKFDLRTYEWAQGIVFDEAEKCKESNVEQAIELYRWVEAIPNRITSIREVSSFEKSLWPKSESFQPSELNLLLGNYAKERQLTLR